MKKKSSFKTIKKRLEELLPVISSRYYVKSIAVFGSYIHDRQTPKSDLDLLVEFEEIPGLFKFLELENYLSDNLGIEVDLVMPDTLKRGIADHVLKEAVRI